MKKVISAVLALVMIFSCFTCGFTVSAEEVEAEEGGSFLDGILNDATNLENFQNAVLGGGMGFDYTAKNDYDIDQMIAEGKIEGQMFGISVDFLYNSNETLYWKNVPVSKDDLTIASGNINTYLKRIIREKYGDGKLFSMELNEYGVPYASYYATNIANFLGNLFYPDFDDVTIAFEGTKTVEEDTFYAAIVRQSGFAELLQNNWCNQGYIDFRPVLETWGLLSGNLVESEYKSGYRLSKKLVAAVINKFISEGPVAAFIDILNVYAKSYKTYLYDATLALFNLRIAAGDIDRVELASLHGIFNIVFNGNNPEAKDKLQFVQMPTNRFALAKDKTELFLYVLLYANINAQYGNNTELFNSFKDEILASDLTDDQKSNINAIIDALLKGDVSGLVVKLNELVMYNIQETPNDWKNAIKNAIASFFKKIADYFDNLFKILSGEKEPPRWDEEN